MFSGFRSFGAQMDRMTKILQTYDEKMTNFRQFYGTSQNLFSYIYTCNERKLVPTE